MTPQQRLDSDIMRALIEQVVKAARGGPEHNVVTYLTEPMWRAFLRGVHPDGYGGEVGQWLQSLSPSVFGSRTVIIPSTEKWAVSFHL